MTHYELNYLRTNLMYDISKYAADLCNKIRMGLYNQKKHWILHHVTSMFEYIDRYSLLNMSMNVLEPAQMRNILKYINKQLNTSYSYDFEY